MKCSGDGGEPIVKDEVEPWCDITRLDVEDKWDCACMLGRESHIDASNRARLPPWEFLAVGEGCIKNVDGVYHERRRSSPKR